MSSTTTPAPSQAHAGSSNRLSGKLSPISIVFMVWAAAAPLTIFVSTPVNMLNGNGAGIAFDADVLVVLGVARGHGNPPGN